MDIPACKISSFSRGVLAEFGPVWPRRMVFGGHTGYIMGDFGVFVDRNFGGLT